MVAVNAAVTLARPLLIKGEPGTGKTQLAQEIALALGWPLHEWHIKSTTRAQQGLYEYDAVSRLRDSQLGLASVHEIGNYIVKGKLWEALESEIQPGAHRRTRSRAVLFPGANLPGQGRAPLRSVRSRVCRSLPWRGGTAHRARQRATERLAARVRRTRAERRGEGTGRSARGLGQAHGVSAATSRSSKRAIRAAASGSARPVLHRSVHSDTTPRACALGRPPHASGVQ